MERYRVFGRTQYAAPLEFQGVVTADGEAAAAAAALAAHGRDWVELSLLPESAIHWILRAEEAADA